MYSESKKDYNYTEKQQSQIVGAFFYGYTISVGSAGFITGELSSLTRKKPVWLATSYKDMYGGRYIVAIGIGMSGFIGMFQPLFVKWGVNWFITIRFLQGLAQGLTFTSQFGFKNLRLVKIILVKHWYPGVRHLCGVDGHQVTNVQSWLAFLNSLVSVDCWSAQRYQESLLNTGDGSTPFIYTGQRLHCGA